jgi:streptogramin lyase
MKSSLRALAALASAAILAACGGGHLPAAPAALPSVTPSTAPAPSGESSVKWAMSWATNSNVRKSQYLPKTALSASIQVITAPDVTSALPIEYLNAPSTSLTFSAPNGLDTFQIKTYDEQNGLGNVLSEANVTQTVTSGSGNVVSSILNGVIASLQISTGSPPAAGTQSLGTAYVNALDADGNTIVGPGDYNTPITLTSSSPHVTLSTKVLQAPGKQPVFAYDGAPMWSATITASASGVPPAVLNVAPTPTIYEYALSNAGAVPQQLVLGPDGNIWFTEAGANLIGTITGTGAITEYTVPTAGAEPYGITAADGKLWFTESATGKVASLTTTGTFSESGVFSTPEGIAAASDGTVWFTDPSNDAVEYITPSVAGFNDIRFAGISPNWIAFGNDNDAYFTASSTNGPEIGRTDDITVSLLPLSPYANPSGIAPGPDGNMWFTEYGTSKIGVLNPQCFCLAGEFQTPTRNSGPEFITTGGDGALWFTESSQNKIGRVTTSGTMSEYPILTLSATPTGIAAGSDGSLWFAEAAAGKIGHLVY